MGVDMLWVRGSEWLGVWSGGEEEDREADLFYYSDHSVKDSYRELTWFDLLEIAKRWGDDLKEKDGSNEPS